MSRNAVGRSAGRGESYWALARSLSSVESSTSWTTSWLGPANISLERIGVGLGERGALRPRGEVVDGAPPGLHLVEARRLGVVDEAAAGVVELHRPGAVHLVADEPGRPVDEVGAPLEAVFEVDLVALCDGDAVGDDDHRAVLARPRARRGTGADRARTLRAGTRLSWTTLWRICMRSPSPCPPVSPAAVRPRRPQVARNLPPGRAMSAPALDKRLRLLRVLHAQPHRYPRIRWITQSVTFLVLYGIPLLGLARFDLWGGRHLAARRPVGPVYGMGAVFVGILSFYLVTFVLNALMGRVFCGFGCPIGQASRLGDDVEAAVKSRKDRRAIQGRAVAFAVALASAIALWFVSPRVFVAGSPRAVAATLAGVAALSAAVYLHGRYWRWRFCEGFCPIGIYYSAVQTGHGFGIHFDAAMHTCKECDSCQLVCPVGLDPRDLMRPKNDIGGIAIDGFAGQNHCLTCGECVRACEHQFRKEGRALVPLRLVSFHRPRPRPPPAPERLRPSGSRAGAKLRARRTESSPRAEGHGQAAQTPRPRWARPCPVRGRRASHLPARGAPDPMSHRTITVDANEAVASVAHRLSEVIAIYPITPSSPMGELCRRVVGRGRENLWGTVPHVVEMQSEGGAAGAGARRAAGRRARPRRSPRRRACC